MKIEERKSKAYIIKEGPIVEGGSSPTLTSGPASPIVIHEDSVDELRKFCISVYNAEVEDLILLRDALTELIDGKL